MSTLLGGELSVNLMIKNIYVPVLSPYKGKEMPLDVAIQTALCEAKTVFVVGPEGSGKTTTLEMLFVNEGKGQELQKFNNIFYFRGADINSLKDPISLKEFLLCSCLPQTPITNTENTLFIFDDMDKFNLILNLPTNDQCSDQTQTTTVSCLVASLICGSLIPGASCLVFTQTKPNLEHLSVVNLDILGFLKPQRDAFFHKFFSDPAVAKNSLQHFEKTLGLYEFSSSPRFCWTVCSTYNFLIESGTKLPNTITQLFVHILAHLLDKIPQKDTMQNLVMALGKLASHSALGLNRNVQRDTLYAFGLHSPPNDFLREDGETENAFYHWLSQLMQEFIIATSFFIDPTSESVQGFFEKHTKHTQFLDVFMAGLCEPISREPLEDRLGLFNPAHMLDFEKWLKKLCEKTLPGRNKKDHFRCFQLLYQLQKESVLREVLSAPARLGISYGNLTDSPADYVALNYVVMHLGELEKLNMYGTTLLTNEEAEILAPTMGVSQQISFSQCSLESGAVSVLASALCKGTCKNLDLSNCRLNLEQFKSLCTGLRSCKLQSLNFSNSGLTAASCAELAPALCSVSSQLNVLELHGNEIRDEGLKKLCEALQSPHCAIESLLLDSCDLTAASMDHLSTAMCSGHSRLQTLSLSRNEIRDEGVEVLSKALQHPLCKLESLSLYDCWLSEDCCPHLMESLMSPHCSLLDIDLSVNEFGQEGALMLCQALKRPGCPIEKLSLVRCELTEVVFVELAAMLKKGSPPLKYLAVGLNKVGNEGVHHLFVALRHPSCELEELDVEMTKLTDSCIKDLCAAIKDSKTLKKLELHNNSLTDASVPALVSVAKASPKMEELNVQYNDFSEDMFEIFDTCSKIRY